eukprot:RCo021302
MAFAVPLRLSASVGWGRVGVCLPRGRRFSSKMGAEEMIDLCKKHSLWPWSAQKAVNPIPMERAEGVYFWDAYGKRYLDMNSQLMCCNIGHGHPKVIAAIKAQADTLTYAGPTMATQARAELVRELVRHTPPGLTRMFFTLGGAEANENAIKLARFYTGRNKVIVRYRSYHGATLGAISLTGDPRRWPTEPGMPGVVRIMDPDKYRSQLFREGEDTDETFAQKCLHEMEEVLKFEGPQNVACVFLETITGTNGIIIPPNGYLQGVRKLCDKYGIVMVCDEVMAGLGRTGQWFAVNNWSVVPDIITCAKGLTSAYLPLGCVLLSEKIAKHFDDKVFYGGLTYHGHPMCLAAATATLKVMAEEDTIGNAQRMGKVLSSLHQEMKQKHPCVGDVRSIGLFGCLELVKNRKTKEPLCPFNGTSPAVQEVAAYLRANGVYAFQHWHFLHTNPPLCITEPQLREGFEVIDKALSLADKHVA